MGSVGVTQPCWRVGCDPVAKDEPAGIVHPIHLAGHPAEATHASPHAAAHAASTHAAAHALAAIDTALPSHAAACLEGIHARAWIDRHHQIGDWIDLDDQVFLGLLLGRDQEHFVFDEVGEIDVAEQQSQGGSQRNPRQVLGDWRVQIDARVFECLDVKFHRDALRIADLDDDIAERGFRELESRHGFIQDGVDFLLLAARVRQVDRLVLLAEAGELLPAFSARVEDGRFIGEGNAGNVGQMEDIHKPAFLVAADAGVLSVVIEDPGDEGGRAAHLASRHRDRIIGVERRRLLSDDLGDVPLRLHKRVRGPLVAHADPLLHQRVIPFGQLLDLLLAPLQLAGQPGPLAADGCPPLVDEIAFHLFPRPHDRFSNPHLDLREETLPHAGVEVVGLVDDLLLFLEPLAGQIGIAGKQVSRRAEFHGRVLLQTLGPHPAHRLEFGEFAARPVGGLSPAGSSRIGGVERQGSAVGDTGRW